MAAKARGSKIDQIVLVKGQRKKPWESITGHVCTGCGGTIEAGELYTRGVGSTPVCRRCSPFELEERTRQQSNDQGLAAREAEASYRRGYAYATEETSSMVLQLVELGYKPTEIRRLLAVYEDYMLAVWRSDGDLDTREAPPAFDVVACQELLKSTTGYDWIV